MTLFKPLILSVLLPTIALALGQPRYVETAAGPGSFPIAQAKTCAAIYVDAGDFPGVVRAAGDLQADIARVTGCTPALAHEVTGLGPHVIVIGSLERSPLVKRMTDTAPIAGKWESFLIQAVPKPLPGVAGALVIAGSDKRGTIYGIYDLSEQIGVSPWYWWADALPIYRLIYHDGLTISTNLFGTTFYSLVGLHAFHVTVGLIGLTIIWLLTLFGAVEQEHSERISVFAMYWHFVDAIWVVVLSVVYFITR